MQSTAEVLAAFNLSSADLLPAIAAASAGVGAASGNATGGVSALTLLLEGAAAVGLDVTPQLLDALTELAANPGSGAAWGATLTAAIGALPANATSGALFSLFGFSGPIPIPQFDEFVGVQRLVRGLFVQSPSVWALYKEVRAGPLTVCPSPKQ